MSAAAGQQKSASKMLYILPIMFMANKINYTDEFINFLRLTYYTVQLGTLILAYIFIRNKILEKNDKTKIFLPPVVNPFAPPDAETARPKESTYHEHEMEQVSMLVRSTLIGIAMVSFMHWKMGVKPVLLMQSIMGPMNLTDNPLVKKYLMGSRDRVYGEALEGEDDATVPLRAGAGAGAGAGRLEQEKKPESAAAKAERMEAVLDKVFNKEAPCAALLKACDKTTINFVSAREGYSPLTVLCSRPDVTEQEVKQALYLGADKFHKDEDGCTALHWAAMKGVVAAAAVLTAAAGSSKALAEVEKLLKTKDGDGKTPLALAKESVEPDHEEVEALLVAAKKKVEAALVVD